ncbi:MAG: acyl-ACP--UDP-N-acetylglucosamine O-acyltransferase [Verrucomicrobiales bacterium]
MTEIHPTAIIHPSAEIGAGCHIGPYCVLHAGVVLGEECWLQNHVTVAGPCVIGPRNKFYAFGSIGQQTQDLKYAGEPTHLEIGSDNTFREFVTFNRGTAPGSYTRIGSHNHLLAYCHVAHDCVVGNHVIFSNSTGLAGHVTVEDRVILGGMTGVHQFCRIGRHAMTGGVAKIVKDIPPFMVADGNPGVLRGLNHIGLERAGFSPEEIRALKEAYKTLFLRGLPQAEALSIVRAQAPLPPSLGQLADFIEASERGITRGGR